MFQSVRNLWTEHKATWSGALLSRVAKGMLLRADVGKRKKEREEEEASEEARARRRNPSPPPSPAHSPRLFRA